MVDHNQNKIFKWLTILFLCTTIVFGSLFAWKCYQQNTPVQETAVETLAAYDDTPESKDGFQDEYPLEQVVVLSRHNIRSPLSDNGSALAKLTPYTWFQWTSGPSELSLRGGDLETMMGQYFRKWLVKENLFDENAMPGDEVRFYANSMQRTIATAEYFSSGMFPVGNEEIEYHEALNTMDPVFTPKLTYVSDAYKEAVMKQIAEMGGSDGLNGIGEGLADNYELLAKVIDLKDSAAAKEDGLDHFSTDDLKINLELDKEPGMSGSLKSACQASDALILQYYEESDSLKASFGYALTDEQWAQLAEIKDVYGDVLFSAPLVAVNVAHPLLQEMQSELENGNRKFTFLCGHDSNIQSVLCALDAESYSLPMTVEKVTPIGSKLVIEKRRGKDGTEYCSLCLIYQSTQQLRDRDMVTLDNPPMKYEIHLNGLQANEDGLYLYSDVMTRLQSSIAAYDALSKY